jgi:hypothetical protein
MIPSCSPSFLRTYIDEFDLAQNSRRVNRRLFVPHRFFNVVYISKKFPGSGGPICCGGAIDKEKRYVPLKNGEMGKPVFSQSSEAQTMHRGVDDRSFSWRDRIADQCPGFHRSLEIFHPFRSDESSRKITGV